MTSALLELTKTRQIGQKQLSALANLPMGQRLDHLATGLPIILSSAETLYASREAVGATGRVGQILRSHSREKRRKS